MLGFARRENLPLITNGTHMTLEAFHNPREERVELCCKPERIATSSIHCLSSFSSSMHLSQAGIKEPGKTFSSAATSISASSPASVEEEDIGEEVSPFPFPFPFPSPFPFPFPFPSPFPSPFLFLQKILCHSFQELRR